MIIYRLQALLPALFIFLFISGCEQKPATDEAGGVVRTYYVAADPVVWDYAPSGYNMITGEPFSEEEKMRTQASDYVIGSQYKKALYREYTDDTFTELKPRSKDWEHLGFMGPLIRAEVGDTIKIVFKNNVKFPASMHPHGVFYGKDSEGALYNDGTDPSLKKDDAVPPGGTHIYTWNVPERAGPPEGGLSTAFWMYHSHTNETKDVNSGLIGPMIVTRKGMAGDDLKPIDVDREFIIAFLSTEEPSSWYIQENIQTYMGKPDEVSVIQDPLFLLEMILSPGGANYGMQDSLNGFTYGNIPKPTMRVGEKVRWYIMAGTGFEVHAPHWHGNVLTGGNMRLDVMELTTMGMQVADMVPDAEGIWMFHCHVANHFVGGMSGMYEVLPVEGP